MRLFGWVHLSFTLWAPMIGAQTQSRCRLRRSGRKLAKVL